MMAKYQTISYLEDCKKEELQNKKALIRVDFNVPLDENLMVKDDTRIVAALDTIKYLLSLNCTVILMSHLGRPDGKIVEKMRLNPVAIRLEEIMQKEVIKLDDCIGDEIEKEISKVKSGEIVLLENLRFHREEEKNDPLFAKKLASLGEFFVNDAFGAVHRAHASTTGVASYLPSFAGFLMAKEVKALNQLLSNPEKPFISIVGGVKISDKIEILEKLAEISNKLLIGGGMAYTFLAAQGFEVGKSILEKDFIDFAKSLMDKAKKGGREIIIPIDILVADEFKADADSFNVPSNQIEQRMIGMDIGTDTILLFKEVIKNARTIFWNGPLGVFEMDKFAHGTNEIAKEIAGLSKKAFTIIGGGDSIAAINKLGLSQKISHISTGGGASLEYIGGKILPGIEALKR